MSRARPSLASAVATLFLLAVLIPGVAGGERTQRGKLIVSVDGGVSPVRLPRHETAPVTLEVGGRISTSDGSPLPRLTKIELALAGRGLLETRGLPTCSRARIRNADNRQALRRCPGALVGSGRLEAVVVAPHQAPFTLDARLLAFNGRAPSGGPAVWVHAYSADPPLSIVLPFLIHREEARLRTRLVTTVPRSLGTLPHLANFELSLGRRYSHRGTARSYLSASCSVPPGFTEGFITLAKATYYFADGRRLGAEAVRSCQTR